jgi:co-chaperonin GroES (HSP10)
MNGDKSTETIKIGGRIVYTKFSGDEVEFEDRKYLVILKRGILAVIK